MVQDFKISLVLLTLLLMAALLISNYQPAIAQDTGIEPVFETTISVSYTHLTLPTKA